MSKKAKSIIIISVSVVFAFIAFITIPMIAKRRVTSEFHSTRASYEECLHAIEGYVPYDSSISHIQVRTDFACKKESGYDYYTNGIYISVFLVDEMRSSWNKPALLNLYPHDVRIRGLIDSMKEQSGYGKWLSENMIDDTIYVDGKPGNVSDKIDIRYIITGNPQRVYIIESNTFKVFNNSDRVEYLYKIENKTLVRFEKTYPVHQTQKSTWNPDKNKKDKKGSSSSNNTTKRSGSSSGKSSKKKYDYYDVYDYDDAWEFANDKYEEFYDYEDDYEDEDEAFDAAEDYWREHHR